ncbi:MAG: RAMP superfamily CRISPR-associated protein [Candidatus Helarchaeota archaeon]
MNYDFYAHFQIEEKDDVDNLTKGSGKYREISDTLSKILLLNTIFGIKDKFPNRSGVPNKIFPDVYAKVGEGDYPMGLKALIHSNGNYNDYISYKLSELNVLGINSSIDLNPLPIGSWVLEFPITLDKPFLSKDDVSLYIIENPIKKEKVFGIPFTSSMAWKGNLRWTMMKIFLEPKKIESDEFAEIRFRHTLLFGTEKGWEEKPKGFSKFLDNLCPNAKEKYRDRLKEFTKKEPKDVSLRGMLHFYPTFWNKIDMMVINPHNRKTKTGTKPIYYESVPVGAKGFFRLIYIPIYWFGLSEFELKKEIFKDLKDIIIGIKETLLIYGFSAKKSSGFGVIKDGWDKNASRIEIKNFCNSRKFSNFEELEKIIKELGENSE